MLPLGIYLKCRMMRQLGKRGLARVIEKLDGGLETLLGKQLEGGIDLSGGQGGII